MALRILTTPADMAQVRALLFPLVSPATATLLLPDSIIALFPVAGRAEQMVISRVGPDWTLIVAGMAPAKYALGDPITALALLKSAAMMLCCSYLCVQMKQLVPTAEKDELINVTRDLDWTALQTEYLQQAQIDLGLLAGTGDVAPAFQLARPGVMGIDPDADPALLRHYPGSFFRTSG